MVSNLAMQSWKCLLSLAPPRTKHLERQHLRNEISLRGSQFTQGEVQTLELSCICPFSHKEGLLVHCWRCRKSQHSNCYYPQDHDTVAVTEQGKAASHECLHCERVTGCLQEPPIANGARVRQAGHTLKTWCGDLEGNQQIDATDDASWENAAMLVSLLVKLIIRASYAMNRCGEAVRVRMEYHYIFMADRMLRLPQDDHADFGSAREMDPAVVGNESCCPEEEFADTAMSLVQGLVELLPAFLGVD